MIHNWSSRKQRSWAANVKKLAKSLSIEDNILYDENSAKTFTLHVKQKIFIHDEQMWFSKLWNDSGTVNENKLRLYRQCKKDLRSEAYVRTEMPRYLRSYICQLRCGTLPLTVETGRFNRPPTPLDERTCPFCNFCVEDEVHFMVDCPIYSDLRFDLFNTCFFK